MTRRQRLTLVATGLGLFMIFLDATIVNVALPDIQQHFDVGEQGLQWVVAAYSLTMGMFIMSAASLSDRHGRRRAYVVGIVIFTAASIGCGLAPSILLLNLARGAQGIGAATVNVASLALVSAAFPDPSTKARAIGIWTGIAAVGLAIGPTLGGVLTEGLGWRSIFLVNAFVGVVAIVLALAFVDESSDPVDRSLDLRGQVLFIVGIGALTYALIEAPHSGWLSPVIVGLFAIAVAIGITFVFVELRSAGPMMDVRVFKDHVYSTAIVTIFVVLFGIYGLMLIVTQYFQNIHGFSPEKAGVLMLAMTVPTVVMSPLAGVIAGKVGARLPTLLGLVALIAGLVTVILGVGGWLGFTLLGLAFMGTASGLAITPATNIAMSSIPPERSGMASGIMSAQRALGSTAGFAVMGSVLAVVVASVLPAKIAPYFSNPADQQAAVTAIVDDANPRAMVGLIGRGKPITDVSTSITPEVVDAADDAFVEGIRAALAVGAVLGLLALAAGFVFFPRRDGSGRDEIEEATETEGEELARMVDE